MHRPDRGRCAWKVGTSTRAGIPDVAWENSRARPDYMYPIGGWLELKFLEAWPKRPSTPLRPGVSMEQRGHLMEWREGGGLASVLLGMPDPKTKKPGALWYVLPPALFLLDAIPVEDLPLPWVLGTDVALLYRLLLLDY
jgi:hypothetical protein